MRDLTNLSRIACELERVMEQPVTESDPWFG